MEDYSEVAELKAHITEELRCEDDTLVFEMEDGSILPEKRFVPGSRVVCGQTSELLDTARKLLHDADTVEAAHLAEDMDAVASRTTSNSKLVLEMLDGVADLVQ